MPDPAILLLKSGKQTTLSQPVSLTGPTPYIPGHSTKMVISPAVRNIRFSYTDSGIRHTIPVDPAHLDSKSRENSTALVDSRAEVRSVEHLLSALAGLNIQACDIELIGSNQVPLPDASAASFTRLLSEISLVPTVTDNYVVRVTRDIFFSDGRGSMAILRPSAKLSLSALIQFPEPIGEQYLKLEINPVTYTKEISWARSYIKSDCDSEVWAICRRKIPALPEDIRLSPVLVFNYHTWIVKPRKPDEPVRHKFLDALGDLSVLGLPLLADITLIRPGHEFNHLLINYLWGLLSRENHIRNFASGQV